MKVYPMEEGYEHIKEQFNGIRELISREDIDAFNELCSNMESRSLIYNDAEVYNSINALEFILFDVMVNNKIDAAEFVNVYCENAEQKKLSEYYENANPLMLVDCMADNEVNPISP